MSPTFYHQSLLVISHFIYLALVYSFFITLPPTSFYCYNKHSSTCNHVCSHTLSGNTSESGAHCACFLTLAILAVMPTSPLHHTSLSVIGRLPFHDCSYLIQTRIVMIKLEIPPHLAHPQRMGNQHIQIQHRADLWQVYKLSSGYSGPEASQRNILASARWKVRLKKNPSLTLRT